MGYRFKNTKAKSLFVNMLKASAREDRHTVLDLSKHIILLEPEINDPAYWGLIGVAHFYLENYDSAKKNLLKSVETDSIYNEFQINPALGSTVLGPLGLVYCMDNDFRPAVKYLEKALEYRKKAAGYSPTDQHTLLLKRGLELARRDLENQENPSPHTTPTPSSSPNRPAGYQGHSGCFIATMLYDDYDSYEVLILRQFRDDFLLKHAIGKTMVRYYYRYAPYWVRQLQNKRRLVNGFRILFHYSIFQMVLFMRSKKYYP